ncbi:MAG: SpoIIE family protein phosphatase [Candidatus Poribacteria bacterium]|nr:SpoIIE family protein phosphatase [Candidatus Poribacteria bacterium]
MQSASAEETTQRLIFSLSELEQLGETIISGHGNFNASSKTYLRMILGTLQVTRGAILLFHPTENHLAIEASINVKDESLCIPVSSDETSAMLRFSVIDLSNPPAGLTPFLNRIAPQLKVLDANFWAPLKIRDEFLGVISLGRFFAKAGMEDWARELLNVLANQTSIAIAYSRLLDKARGEQFRLFHLSDVAVEICKQLDTEAVVEEVVNYAVALLDASAGGLMRIDPLTQRLEMKYVFNFDLTPNAERQEFSIPLKTDGELSPALSMLAEVVRQDRPLICNDVERAGLFGRKKLMAVPMFGRENILGVLVVGDKEGRGGVTLDFTAEDEILLTAFANQAGVAIENAQLYQEALEGRRLQAEMEEAAKIQQNLIPDTLPEIPGYEVQGLYHPRGNVGGDYYDYIEEANSSWGLAIADVSGKGMQAALLMATLRAGLLSEVARQKDLSSMAINLNALLYASGTPGKYATFFYARLQPETDLLTTVNAGHNNPLLIRSDGNCQWLGTEKGGAPLGMFPDDMLLQIAEYEQETTELFSGDVVVFYTDGVTETENLDDELYGEERLERAVKRLHHASANEICTAIYDDVMEFQGEAAPFDDLTLMVLRKT